MKLENDTGLSADLFRSSIDDERILAAVVVRMTFDIQRDGSTRLAEDQSLWPISPKPRETPHGAMEADEIFHREGVDLFVFGDAVSAREQRVAAVEVRVRTPKLERRAIAIGERVWQNSLGTLVPSTPRHFSRLPLSLSKAFGGHAEWDGLKVPFPGNPDGIGFYLDARQATEQPLPQIEDPRNLIKTWSDRPVPVGFGFCRRDNGQRLERGLEINASTGELEKVNRGVLNRAFPAMILPSLSADDPIELHGMDRMGAVGVRVPKPILKLELSFDDKRTMYPLRLEELGIEVLERRCFATYRFPFKYVIRSRQLRHCRLLKED